MNRLTKKISSTQHGIAKQYVLFDNGRRQEMLDNGEANIANIAYGEINGENLPFMVFVVSLMFCETYKEYVNNTDFFIVKSVYSDDDVVLLVKNRQYCLADYKDGKFIDRANQMPIEANEDIKIIGAILKRITSVI